MKIKLRLLDKRSLNYYNNNNNITYNNKTRKQENKKTGFPSDLCATSSLLRKEFALK